MKKNLLKIIVKALLTIVLIVFVVIIAKQLKYDLLLQKRIRIDKINWTHKQWWEMYDAHIFICISSIVLSAIFVIWLWAFALKISYRKIVGEVKELSATIKEKNKVNKGKRIAKRKEHLEKKLNDLNEKDEE